MRRFLIVIGALALTGVSIPVAVSHGGRSATTTGRAPFPKNGVLAFTGSCDDCRGYGGSSGLLLLRTDGASLGFLTGGVGASYPRWRPDGRWVAVSKSMEIVLLPLSDRGFRIVTHPPDLAAGMGDDAPSWYPDGKRLVFTRLSTRPAGLGGYEPTAIWSVGADGRGARKLLAPRPQANGDQGPNVIDPEISPNGRRLAYGDIAQRLWVAKSDGTGRRRLGRADAHGEQPRWSPDGRWIAYLDTDAERLRILDVETGRSHALGIEGALQWGQAWSPDGKWLAVASSVPYDCDDPDGCSDFEIWIANATDGRARRILRSAYGSIDGLDWRRQPSPLR